MPVFCPDAACIANGRHIIEGRKNKNVSKWKLNRHNMRYHNVTKKFKCPAEGCVLDFPTNGQLGNHLECHRKGTARKNPVVKKANPDDKWICQYCSKDFLSNTILQTHIRIHTGEKPFVCNVCEKAFSTKGGLNVHLRIHTSERPFACHICDLTFNLRGSLKKHLHTHTTDPRYCNTCEELLAPGIRKADHEKTGNHLRMLEVYDEVREDETTSPTAFPSSTTSRFDKSKFKLNLAVDQRGVITKPGHEIVGNLKCLDNYAYCEDGLLKTHPGHQNPSYGMSNVSYILHCPKCQIYRSGQTVSLLNRMNSHLDDINKSSPITPIGRHFKNPECLANMVLVITNQAVPVPPEAKTAPAAFRRLSRQIQLDNFEILDHQRKGWDPLTAKTDTSELNEKPPGERHHKVLKLPVWKSGRFEGLEDAEIYDQNFIREIVETDEDEDDLFSFSPPSTTNPKRSQPNSRSTAGPSKKWKRIIPPNDESDDDMPVV